MRHTQTQHLLLTALLILTTACSASPSGGAGGPTPIPLTPKRSSPLTPSGAARCPAR